MDTSNLELSHQQPVPFGIDVIAPKPLSLGRKIANVLLATSLLGGVVLAAMPAPSAQALANMSPRGSKTELTVTGDTHASAHIVSPVLDLRIQYSRFEADGIATPYSPTFESTENGFEADVSLPAPYVGFNASNAVVIDNAPVYGPCPQSLEGEGTICKQTNVTLTTIAGFENNATRVKAEISPSDALSDATRIYVEDADGDFAKFAPENMSCTTIGGQPAMCDTNIDTVKSNNGMGFEDPSSIALTNLVNPNVIVEHPQYFKGLVDVVGQQISGALRRRWNSFRTYLPAVQR